MHKAAILLLACSALACSRSKERAHDAPPTSTAETLSAPISSSASAPKESPPETGSKPAKKWMKGTVTLATPVSR